MVSQIENFADATCSLCEGDEFFISFGIQLAMLFHRSRRFISFAQLQPYHAGSRCPVSIAWFSISVAVIHKDNDWILLQFKLCQLQGICTFTKVCQPSSDKLLHLICVLDKLPALVDQVSLHCTRC